MENGETTLEAAARETLEEACARVEVLGLYAIFNLPHINQVYVMFRGRLLDLDYAVGSESLEVGLFERDAIPWSELAFATVHHTLKFWLDDFPTGNFPMRMGDIVPRDGRAEILMHVAKT
jgi:ADP-ribose pyrophosphatase YjhB (NUDIX family)